MKLCNEVLAGNESVTEGELCELNSEISFGLIDVDCVTIVLA